MDFAGSWATNPTNGFVLPLGIAFPIFSGIDAGIGYFRPQIRILHQTLAIYSISEVWKPLSRSNIRKFIYESDVLSGDGVTAPQYDKKCVNFAQGLGNS